MAFLGFLWIVIPVGFLFGGVVAKKIASPKRTLCQDFYLGIDLGLVALSTTILNGLDLYRQSHNLPYNVSHKKPKDEMDEEQLRNYVSLVLAFAFFIAVVALHRSWEDRETPTRRKRITKECILIGVGNALGIASLLCFTVYVKGFN